MLAYVFWHVPRPQADRARYEAALRMLHARLKQCGAVTDSLSYRIEGAAWVNGGGPAYEDWYAVTDWAALGALNTGAVTAERKLPHDEVAAAYGTGAGGVYELRAGHGQLREASSAQWLAKPHGMPYAHFDELLTPMVERGALWRRQMVLGPGTEFVLTGGDAQDLPAPLQAVTIRRTSIGP